MPKKPGRACKICLLKKSHPEAHERITTQIMKGSDLSIQKLLKILNNEFNINITPMNYQSHKGHTLDGKVHELKETPKVKVYSKEGNLQYTNIEEIIKNLNPKHKLFCELYVNNCNRNGSKAYKEVYGTDNVDKTARTNAWVLRSNTDNMLYIKHLTEIRREEIGVNENFVLEQTKELIDRCMQAEPVFDKQGDPTGEWQFNANGANKALAELGKYLKMDKPKEVTPDQNLYKKILEDFISNKLNPLTASVELEKAGIEMPELLKIAMRKVDPSILDKPAITEDMNLDDLTDEELDRLEAENDL